MLTVYRFIYRLAHGSGGRGECPNHVKREGELSGRGNVRGNMSRREIRGKYTIKLSIMLIAPAKRQSRDRCILLLVYGMCTAGPTGLINSPV